jgi:hypothetical protein
VKLNVFQTAAVLVLIRKCHQMDGDGIRNATNAQTLKLPHFIIGFFVHTRLKKPPNYA